MSASFARSLHVIRSDRAWLAIAGTGAAGLLCIGWVVWLFAARVTLHEVSAGARLEAVAAPHRVASPFAARVAQVHISLGRRVQEGDVLVELDATELHGKLAEQRARQSALETQIGPLQREVAARSQALPASEGAVQARVVEASARAREAELAANLSKGEESRTLAIRQEGVVADSEAARATAEARMKKMAAKAQRNAVRRLKAEGKSQVSELRADVAGLERELAELEGELETVKAGVGVLVGEIERRKIRAPISGQVGEVAALRPGAFLREGDLVVTIVPEGDLRVVAEFPLATVGRLEVGQPASMQLDAFPWTEYGVARAVVASVGTEAWEGRVRVEFALSGPQPPSIRLQHGLSGRVEVETERVAPAALILRAAGKMLQRLSGDS